MLNAPCLYCTASSHCLPLNALFTLQVWKAQLAAGSFRQPSLSGSVPVSLKHLKKRRAGELSLTSSAEKISSSPQPEDRALITSAQGSDLTRFSFLL